MANDGVTKLEDTNLWQAAPDELEGNVYSPFIAEFSKVFKVTDSEASSSKLTDLGYVGLNGQTLSSIVLPYFHFADGSTVFVHPFNPSTVLLPEQIANIPIIKSKGGKLPYDLGQILIDVNGDKGPNKAGRDLFELIVAPNGSIYAEGGYDYALYIDPLNPEAYHWKTSTNVSLGCSDGNIKQVNGYGCTARIIDEGWQMNY